jgi:hypothetical protein
MSRDDYVAEAFRAKSAAFLAVNFLNKLARWNSTVRGLILSMRATSLLVCPTRISPSIHCSRGVRVVPAVRN